MQQPTTPEAPQVPQTQPTPPKKTTRPSWTILIVLAIIAIAINAYAVWRGQGEKPIEPSELPEAEKTATQVVREFYQCYVKKLEERDNYESNIQACEELEENFRQRLLRREVEPIPHADPILWAQAVPPADNLQVSQIAIEDKTASVRVTFLPTWPNHKLRVSLSLVGLEWKITEIISEEFLHTADWKTYQNEKYGYEVKYPQGWYSYTSNPADIYLQPKKEIAGAIPGPHADAFEIKINNVLSGITLLEAIQEEFRKEGNEGIDFSQENVKIGETDGLKIKTICEGVGCGAPEWFVIKDNYLYHFDSNLGYTETFDQILSTFKFVETEEAESYIKIISPNGGGKWVAGNTYSIEWRANEVEEGSIGLTDNKGDEAVLAPRIFMKEGINSFSWTIGGSFTPTKKESRKWDEAQGYKIVIYGNGIKDVSDDYFSIIKKP